MATIDIERGHDKSLADARKAIEKVARRLAERFDVEYDWNGNTLSFQRSGVSGAIAVAKGTVRVTAKLGLLLSALRGTVETEIGNYLEREFGPEPD
jgi:putative polyhydroxyalkanoate system protein